MTVQRGVCASGRPLRSGQEVLTKRDEITTVSLTGCWQQFKQLSSSLKAPVQAQWDNFCSGNGLVPLDYGLFCSGFCFKSVVFIFFLPLIRAMFLCCKNGTSQSHYKAFGSSVFN